MRAAPAVVVELRCPPSWRAAQAVLATAAAAACTAVVLQHAGVSGPLMGAGLAVAAAAAALIGWRWASADGGRLRWDGGRWWYRPSADSEERPGRLRAPIDLGFWMLLRFDPDDATWPATRRAWLAVEGAAAPPLASLRAAVYSRRLNTDPDLHRREGETE
jgi:hypothetical protein